jgi:hypothetical protein
VYLRSKIIGIAVVAGTIIGKIIHRVVAVIEFLNERYTDIIVGFKLSDNDQPTDQNRK